MNEKLLKEYEDFKATLNTEDPFDQALLLDTMLFMAEIEHDHQVKSRKSINNEIEE